ncbi:MAG: hypothetical protein LUC86_03560, partial [Prevotellaceae bacterium]|nr:hypothetical protein [Prevotellaceae bacterium]
PEVAPQPIKALIRVAKPLNARASERRAACFLYHPRGVGRGRLCLSERKDSLLALPSVAKDLSEAKIARGCKPSIPSLAKGNPFAKVCG